MPETNRGETPARAPADRPPRGRSPRRLNGAPSLRSCLAVAVVLAPAGCRPRTPPPAPAPTAPASTAPAPPGPQATPAKSEWSVAKAALATKVKFKDDAGAE